MYSERYEERRPLFDAVFSNGVDQYVHSTGVIGVKLVVNVDEKHLDPYRSSPYGRSTQSGAVSVFLADNEETAKAEVYQGNPPKQYPTNTWLLSYKYQGTILNIQRIEAKEFTDQFLTATGHDKHEFSRDARAYLSEKGLTSKFDSIGWVSVQGDKMGIGGFVYNWTSGVEPTFEHLNTIRLDGR